MEVKIRDGGEWKVVQRRKNLEKKKKEYEFYKLRAVLEVSPTNLRRAERVQKDLLRLERELSMQN